MFGDTFVWFVSDRSLGKVGQIYDNIMVEISKLETPEKVLH